MKNTNPQEFAQLYEEVYQDMFRLALYTLGRRQDAEDVVSDAVTDAYSSFHKLRDIQAFRPWIFKILSAKCKRKLKEYVHKTSELPDDLFTSEDLSESLQVRQAFGRLNEEERLIISLHLFGGYNSQEIGKTLHLNDNTVRSKESRALAKMREWIEG